MGKIFRWTLLLVVLVIFTSGAVAFYTVFFSAGNDITMPLLRNMSLSEAEQEASRLGLTINTTSVESSLPQWQVVAQEPEVGARVRNDRTIILTVSRGGPRRSIPDVRRLAVAEAQSTLQEHGFNIGSIIYIQDNSRPGGTVIAQSPSGPANIPTDQSVDLLVSHGGASADGRIIVPDVAGMSERQARELLTASGFRIAAVDSAFSLNDASGHVMSTRPSGGTAAMAGDGIRLRVATNRRPGATPELPLAQPTPTPPQPELPTPLHVDIVEQIPPIVAVVPPPQPSETQALNPNLDILDQQPLPQLTPAPVIPQPAPTNLEPVAGRVARIRYQVPPLVHPLPLRIELVDPTGTRVLLNRDARSGELISLDVPYSRESVVRIYLGNEFVWQDRFM